MLRARAIDSQAALGRALRDHGVRVTQATLSRDLKELRIPCVPTADGGYRYVVPDAGPDAAATPRTLRSMAAVEVTHIDANEMVIVVRTLTGRAQGVAVYLDGLKLPDLLATIAGDDTIAVIPRQVRRLDALRAELTRILNLERH